jgi:hypothetical protein
MVQQSDIPSPSRRTQDQMVLPIASLHQFSNPYNNVFEQNLHQPNRHASTEGRRENKDKDDKLLGKEKP